MKKPSISERVAALLAAVVLLGACSSAAVRPVGKPARAAGHRAGSSTAIGSSPGSAGAGTHQAGGVKDFEHDDDDRQAQPPKQGAARGHPQSTPTTKAPGAKPQPVTTTRPAAVTTTTRAPATTTTTRPTTTTTTTQPPPPPASITISNFAFHTRLAVGACRTKGHGHQQRHRGAHLDGRQRRLQLRRPQPGQSFSFAFTTPGTFKDRCTIHTFMTGTVVVR